MYWGQKNDEISIKKTLFYLLHHHFYRENHDIRHILLILQREAYTSSCMPGKCIYIERSDPQMFVSAGRTLLLLFPLNCGRWF